MIGWECGGVISERNFLGCKAYLNLSTNNFNKFSALSSALLQVITYNYADTIQYRRLSVPELEWILKRPKL